MDSLTQKNDDMKEIMSEETETESEDSLREVVNSEKKIFETYTKYDSEIKQIKKDINLYINNLISFY